MYKWSLAIKTSFAFVSAIILSFSYSAIAQTKSPTITFTSDTQAPLFIERIIRKTGHNEKATEMIFKDVVARQPTSLFILGDVVSLGDKNAKWKNIDRYLQWCAKANIPVYATLGNHELMWSPKKGKQKFQARFPMHSPVGYFEISDSIAVILLNSNFSHMTSEEITQQDDWYHKTIKEFDDDPAIKFIIVGCHHSPYTNSKVVAPSLPVQTKFVPEFINSKKAVLFLSGHSHNFEQFKVEGKCFLVIGGGGGVHQPLNTKNQSTYDLSPNYKPMFHYLEVKRYKDSLTVISRRLKPDFSGFENGLTFNVAL